MTIERRGPSCRSVHRPVRHRNNVRAHQPPAPRPHDDLDGSETTSLRATISRLRRDLEQLLVLTDDLDRDRTFAEQQMWRYQTLFDTAPEAYIVTDAAGVIVDVNGAAQHLLQEDAHRLMGTPLGQRIRRVDGLALKTALAIVAALGGRARWRVHVTGEGGHEHQLEASVATGTTASGALELRWILHAPGVEAPPRDRATAPADWCDPRRDRRAVGVETPVGNSGGRTE